MTLRSLALAAILCLSLVFPAVPSAATPARYTLDKSASTVAFDVPFGADKINGRMPVAHADIALDFDRPAASRVNVAMSAAGARTSLPFATGAMKSESVLDTGRHPNITFTSTSLASTGPNSARVEGMLTMRGVTRPVTLDARIFRTAGDSNALSVELNTAVSRAAFGATGYPDMVGDTVRIHIRALLNRGE